MGLSDTRHYVPILRAKRAERDALTASHRLHDQMTPLVEIPPIDTDGPISQAISSRIHDFIMAWPHQLLLDLQTAVDEAAADVAEAYTLARRTVQGIRQEFDIGVPDPIPVVDLNSSDSYLTAVRAAMADQANPPTVAAVRLRRGQLGRPRQLRQRLEELLSRLGAEPSRAHLVLDFGADVDTSYAEMATLALPDMRAWAGFTLAWGAFPPMLGPEEIQVIGRRDWTTWQELYEQMNDEGLRAPGFGDYSVVHPETGPSVPRAPHPNLRVCRQYDWIVRRERRQPLEGNEGIYRVAEDLVRSGEIEPDLSDGDKWIDDHARHEGTTGNATTWISVGHQRHLAFVSRQVASLPDA